MQGAPLPRLCRGQKHSPLPPRPTELGLSCPAPPHSLSPTHGCRLPASPPAHPGWSLSLWQSSCLRLIEFSGLEVEWDAGKKVPPLAQRTLPAPARPGQRGGPCFVATVAGQTGHSQPPEPPGGRCDRQGLNSKERWGRAGQSTPGPLTHGRNRPSETRTVSTRENPDSGPSSVGWPGAATGRFYPQGSPQHGHSLVPVFTMGTKS